MSSIIEGSPKDKSFDNIPQELKGQQIWVLWKKEQRGDKETKIPYQPSGVKAKSNDPSTWSSWGEVLGAYAKGGFDGVGACVVSPYVFVDLDKCFEGGKLKSYAREIVEKFSSYTEISPSGNGLHIICRGRKPEGGNRNTELGIEVYDKGRYFTFTGKVIEGLNEIREATEALNWLQEAYLGKEKRSEGKASKGKASIVEKKKKTECTNQAVVTQAVVTDKPQTDDKIVLERLQLEYPEALDLLAGDMAGYPSASERDQALCNYLALCSTGKTRDEIEAQIIRIIRNSGANREKWSPEHFDHYIRPTVGKAIAFAIRKEEEFTAGSGRSSIATKTFKWLINNYELWYDQNNHAYITAGGRDLRIGSKEFRVWLHNLYQELYNRTLPPAAFRELQDNLEARALNGRMFQTHKRVAWQDGKIYFDLGHNSAHTHKYVEISREGWKVVDSVTVSSGPVKFIRTQDMLPLPEPQKGGDWKGLLQLINTSHEGKVLILAWLLQGLWETRGHYTHLFLSGIQGTGKSFTMSLLKGIIDPSTKIGRSFDKINSVYDLGLASTTERILSFDNVSHIPGEISDALCTASRGGVIARRELYKAADEISFQVHFPAIFTGINVIRSRPDLLDRLIVVTMEPLEEVEGEEVLLERFEEILPQILGLLCDAAACGLRNLKTTERVRDVRMVDFCHWVCACVSEGGLPFTPEEFLEIYRDSIRQERVEALDGLGSLLIDVAKPRAPWTVQASGLLEELRYYKETNHELYGDFKVPQDAKGFGQWLNRNIPVLKAHGLIVKKEHRKAGTFYKLELDMEAAGQEAAGQEAAGNSCCPQTREELESELKRRGLAGVEMDEFETDESSS